MPTVPPNPEPRTPNPVPLSLAINLDQVGRLRDGALLWEWAGDAKPSVERPAFLANAAATTGIVLRAGEGFSRRTDGESFAAAGIPALCLYTGSHDDVHRPTDTPDRLDAAGIERIAALVALAAIEQP